MSNYQLGPCSIIDISVAATPVDLGKTQGGVSVKIEESTVEMHTDQDGETPVDERITGTKITIEASLADITAENLAMILKTTVVTDAVKIKPNLGMSLLDESKELLIKPWEGGAVSTDSKQWLYIPKAGIKASVDMNYNGKDQRVLKMTIVGYPDGAITGSPIAVYGVASRAAAIALA